MVTLQPIKVNSLSSSIEDSGSISANELLSTIPETLYEGFVYAVFDHIVCLGIMANGVISFKTGETNIEKELDFLQELRIFNESREFRAIRVHHQFRWRIRADVEQKNNKPVNYFDETHQLWGKASAEPKNNWTLLAEKRGTELWFPAKLDAGDKKGIKIRQYLEFSEKSYQFTDERLVCFVDWPKEESEDGK